MASTTTSVRQEVLYLPTDEELREARYGRVQLEDALVNIANVVTQVDEWGDRNGSKSFPFGVLVDDAAIGRLYRFVADMELDVEHLAEHVKEIRHAVYSLHATASEYDDHTRRSAS